MMEAEIIDAYEARGECDQDEGRGGTYAVGYALYEAHAKLLAEGRGVFGTPGTVRVVKAVRFADGTMYVLGSSFGIASHEKEMTARALAKLTSDERKLLGLGEP